MSDYNGPPQDLGQRLNLSGAGLTTTYQGGDSLALAGTEQVTAKVDAVFRNGSDLTDTRFRWAATDTPDVAASWRPIAGVRGSDGAVVDELVLDKVSATTVREVFTTTSHRSHKYVRLEAKHTGGTPTADDKAQASVGFIP